ncbi:MAG: ABC transporter permease [Ruthenibacterium sp.]
MRGKSLMSTMLRRAAALLLTAGLFGSAFLLNRQMNKAVPNAVEVYNTQGIGVSVSEQPFALAAEQTVRLGDVSVRAMTTNSVYAATANLQFVHGGYFLPDAVTHQRHYAVLPDTLALRLFGSVAVSGSEITVSGEIYTICGIISTDSHFLNAVSRGTDDTIYLSRPIGALSEDTAAQQALLTGGAQSVDSLLQAAHMASGVQLFGTVHDLRAPRILAQQIFYLAWMLLALVPLWWLLRFGGRHSVQLYTMPKNSRHAVLLQVAKSVLPIAAGFGILWLLCKNISIPAVYLPQDNLFDIAHYRDLIVRFYQQKSSALRVDVYSNAIAAYLPTILLCCVGADFLFVSFLFKITEKK